MQIYFFAGIERERKVWEEIGKERERNKEKEEGTTGKGEKKRNRGGIKQRHRILPGEPGAAAASPDFFMSLPHDVPPAYCPEEPLDDPDLSADSFSCAYDCVSISSFPGERLMSDQDDTASLVSTATLVPECIYIPPAGYQLLSDKELSQQKIALQSSSEQLDRVTEQKAALQEALRGSSEDCANQILLLLDQIKNSEQLLQNLQRTMCDTQQKTTRQMSALTASFSRLCEEVKYLNDENEKLRSLSCDAAPGEQRPAADPTSPRREAQHRQERLCIEIVALQEELNTELGAKRDLEEQLRREREAHTEEMEIMEATLSSVRTEMERTQQDRRQSELQLQESEGQVQKLWESLSDQEKLVQEERLDKTWLQDALSEEKSKVVRLQTELGTSEEVQRDFVRLSQALQVSLERIRQAGSLKQVQDILEGTRLKDVSQLKDT
ncbi:rab GTPase-binding effector protein 2 [Ascaphus truei]|uniref:rab GTPase-binding effector protein 2 n=1 Tax=Ascaphus truei TaxID=8439 RepID=UPI003F5A4242